MSYCRFAWDGSDVYVIGTDAGICCVGCRLNRDSIYKARPEDMLVHLALHRRAGDFVPEYAVTRLWGDIEGASVPPRPEPELFTRIKAGWPPE